MPSRCAEEGADRVARRSGRGPRARRRRRVGRERTREERTAVGCAGRPSARAPASVTGSKLHVRSATRPPDAKLRGSNGWSGWRTSDALRGPARRAGARRRVDDVEQLADRDGRRPGRVGPLVVAGVGDDQPLGRREQGVEQQLAVLAARVAVADVGIIEHQVVAVARRLAGEHAVVEPEQADHPVGDRAHREKRADRQVAGAEVRPGRPAVEAVGEQAADLGRSERGSG